MNTLFTPREQTKRVRRLRRRKKLLLQAMKREVTLFRCIIAGKRPPIPKKGKRD
jgi:hypothetical protein